MSQKTSALTAQDFNYLMQAFEPFEDRPRITVAVSGGSDSLALVLLANEWVKDRKGELMALTVDHGLRTESAGEAHQVSKWLASYHIAHKVLSWSGNKPITGIQEAARQVRYELLENWCQEAGYLHLLLGHHKEDQEETILMRSLQHSGLMGLAGMSAVVEKPFLRLLRPLLRVSKLRLKETLVQRSQAWVEDKSNMSSRFQRGALRQSMSQFASLSLDVLYSHLLLQRYRQAVEAWLNRFLSREAHISPLGFVMLKRHAFLALPVDFQHPVLLHILKVIGVGTYPPKSSTLNTMLHTIKQPDFKAATCHGVYLSVYLDHFRFVREWRRVEEHYDPHVLATKKKVNFDCRFEIQLDKLRASGCNEFSLRRVGQDGWQQLLAQNPDFKGISVPKPVLWGLPSAWRGSEILLQYNMIYEWFLDLTDAKKQRSFIFKPQYPFSCFIFLASS